MHKETIEINVFDKGDYVRTPYGVGIVIDVENWYGYRVLVKHKFHCGNNPGNKVKTFDNDKPILITKEEYDNTINLFKKI
jgi:hypothetical protein